MADATSQLKLVIVEDDKFLQKILTTKFAKEGFEVHSAFDGEEALKTVAAVLPQIVLLDLILPKLPGFEVLADLKTRPATKDIPVIIISNLAQDEDKARGRDLGAVEFIVKADFSINEVVSKVKEIYAKHLQSKK